VKTAEEARRLLSGVLERTSADDATASYGWGSGHATRFGENAITQNMGREGDRLSLEVAFGTRHGSSSTTLVSEEGVADLVRRAEANAKASARDPEYVPPAEPQEYPEVPQRFYEEAARLSPNDLAGDVAGAIGMVKEDGLTTGGLFSYGHGCWAMANSRGLFAYDRHSGLECSLTVHGDKGSGAASANGEAPGQVDAGEVARRALETARAAQDPEGVEPGDYTVVFEPQAVADLLEFFLWNLDARGADEGRTALAGKVGERIAAGNVTISTAIDSPVLPAAPFGEDGLASKPVTWIRDGVLERLRHSRYWAAEKDTNPDPILYPVFMEGEGRSVEELVAQCESGLLVKRLWYIRYVDMKEMLLTGMTRDGLFRIEKGKVAGPVKNLRFNESPLVFLANAAAMSAPERVGDGLVVPGVMSEGFTFSSKTESV
jgi:predicted Zn-dependent protease